MIFTGIDIFCHVIDNLGDAGVVYRFASEMKLAHPACGIRVFIDDMAVLTNIDPAIIAGSFMQEHGGVIFIDSTMLDAGKVETLGFADVLIEAFGCYTPDCYLEKALFACPLIINLEYLSAEPWVEGYHLKESLLPKGTAKKYFFMPGFTESTGGVILNSRVQRRKGDIVAGRIGFLNELLSRTGMETPVFEGQLIGTVFTYERGFDTLLAELEQLNREVLLFCFGRKSRGGMEHTLTRLGALGGREPLRKRKNISIVFMPFISQQEYDTLLCCTDFNMVRGEDSLVQAIGAGIPFIWNAYLQDEKYQHIKVEAFCAAFQPYFDDEKVFAAYRKLMLQFNDAAIESPGRTTGEQYRLFFRDLEKIEHATSKMCYFIRQNCNLVGKFSDFIREFKRQ
ncbi:MAG: elongation factor P maturation arginine rhamnosyltransferase EarP [Chitinispirillaceae bacterium]|nr:elongation factor P maturation arginine rhamnosyltransferase EarP [Chitinispirillaceae bacterium]